MTRAALSKADAPSGSEIGHRCLLCENCSICSLASSFIDLDDEQLETPPSIAGKLTGLRSASLNTVARQGIRRWCYRAEIGHTRGAVGGLL
jgi:hypothetical protein